MSMRFYCEHKDLDGSVTQSVELSTNDQGLLDVLEAFGYFLKGCGYSFDGNVGLINETMDDFDEPTLPSID